jgi:putative PIN family toxin of toxin-antitoxin system
VVLDTNVLVASAYAPGSASRRLVEACLRGDLVAVLSGALKRECEYIVERAVRRDEGPLRDLLERALLVELGEVPRVVPDDPEDDKVLATALAGGAQAVVTNDRHLLGLDPFGPVRVLRPADALSLLPAGE